MNSNLPYWLAANYLPNLKPYLFFQWLENFPDIVSLFHAPVEQLTQLGIPQKRIAQLQQINWQSIEQDLVWESNSNLHTILTYADQDYPQSLKNTADPPLVLYICGNRFNLCNQQIAMVGSRQPTRSGIQHAEYFADGLSHAGLTITSGLAEGIDGASHAATLRANGVTVGVAGTGLNYIYSYPRANRSLVEKMLANGSTIISELPLATPPFAMNFPRRNRMIAGLSQGVLVVEAALKSGSLITARLAAEYGREVFAVPGPIRQPMARGCHYLIRQGAKLVESVEDILEELLGEKSKCVAISGQGQQQAPVDLSTECLNILQIIGEEITPIDRIIIESGLTASEVSSILLTLELRELIQLVSGGYVKVINTVGHHV